MLKQTPLAQQHQLLHAHMVPFAGWEMPLHYGSQLKEHQFVRHDAGMFDVSHMVVVDIEGPQTQDYIRRLLANNIDRLQQTPGKAMYSCMLNEQGGVIDDLICYYLDSEQVRLVVNAATADSDIAWMQQQADGYQLQLLRRNDLAMLALQGPKATAFAKNIVSSKQAAVIDELSIFEGSLCEDLFIARTGYTGEDGLEIIIAADKVAAFWQSALQAGFMPCGLGARDSLRLEAGLNLYGQDMDTETTPYNSNLAWTVALEPEDRLFIGRQALEAQRAAGITERLVGLLLLDKGVLRSGQRVAGKDAPGGVGIITSGGFAPTVGRSIALARLAQPIPEYCQITIRDKECLAKVVKPPFVRHGKVLVSIE